MQAERIRTEETTQAQRRTGSLASRLWGLSWEGNFPAVVAGGDVRIEVVDLDQVLPFLAPQGIDPARETFYREAADCWAFIETATGRVIGASIANPSDFSTYYLRYVRLSPEFRGRGLYGEFLARQLAALRACSVERVEAEISPLNLHFLKLHADQGFIPTGTVNTDRWGSLVKITCFLKSECQDRFANWIHSGSGQPIPQRRAT